MPTSRYHELLQERADLTAEGEAVFKAAEAAGRGLTPDEQAADDAREQKLQAIRSELAIEERRRARQAEVGATLPDGPRLSLSPSLAVRRSADGRLVDASGNTIAKNANGFPRLIPVASDEEYARFRSGRDLASLKPWGSDTGAPFGEYLQAVHQSEQRGLAEDPRLAFMAAASGANETVPSDGGYLVQQDFASALLMRVQETGVFVRDCPRLPISGNSNGTKINAIDETSRVNGSQWGGVQVYRAAEADTVTASRPRFRQIKLELEKLMGLCYATDENLADAAQLEAVIMMAFPNVMGWKLDNEAIRGTGAGEMLGILNSPCFIAVAKETGQAAATVQYENVANVMARFWAPAFPRATWYYNQDVLPQLMTMSLVIGTGGVPVFLPPGAASAAPFGTLLGRPLQPLEQCSTLGTVGDLILADPTQYVMIEKGGIQSASSMHVRFLNDEMVFRFTARNDGEPLWSSALTPSNGTNTQSPFVGIATR